MSGSANTDSDISKRLAQRLRWYYRGRERYINALRATREPSTEQIAKLRKYFEQIDLLGRMSTPESSLDALVRKLLRDLRNRLRHANGRDAHAAIAAATEATRAQAGELLQRMAELRRVQEAIRESVEVFFAERHPNAVRRQAGIIGNAAREVVEGLDAAVLGAIAVVQELEATYDPLFDPTLPSAKLHQGSLHPLTLVQRELEDIFTSMGYHVLEGPEVELEAYNFEKLNIPADHPARDATDTFYCEPLRAGASLVLRTHTSPVQVRAMERLTPPFRAIAPGRVFRSENTDATHEHTFHQMEGLVVGEDVTVAQLVGTMKAFLRAVFRVDDLEVRLRPGFFPFVEPGFELDARCPFCTSGCRICKGTRWIELCPCGMVHPNVLRAGGIDPERWRGFAFGLGLSRLVMLRYGIDDLRHLLGGDVRFLGQFA